MYRCAAQCSCCPVSTIRKSSQERNFLPFIFNNVYQSCISTDKEWNVKMEVKAADEDSNGEAYQKTKRPLWLGSQKDLPSPMHIGTFLQTSTLLLLHTLSLSYTNTQNIMAMFCSKLFPMLHLTNTSTHTHKRLCPCFARNYLPCSTLQVLFIINFFVPHLSFFPILNTYVMHLHVNGDAHIHGLCTQSYRHI